MPLPYWAWAAVVLPPVLVSPAVYAVIAASGPSMKLAEVALDPARRGMLFERQKKLSREGHRILRDWVRKQNGGFSVGEPVATSIAFVRYNFDMPSVELADHIRKQASVLVAPGSYLGTEHHLRITVGYEPEKVRTALQRISAAVASLEPAQASAVPS